MGSHFLTAIVKTKSEKKFFKIYDQTVQSEKMEYGSNPYSGTWATIPEVMVVSDPFPNKSKWTDKKIRMVFDWLADNTEKWEPAKAVKTSKGYVVGGWAVS